MLVVGVVEERRVVFVAEGRGDLGADRQPAVERADGAGRQRLRQRQSGAASSQAADVTTSGTQAAPGGHVYMLGYTRGHARRERQL